MSEHQNPQRTTMVQGIFCVILGAALLLNTVIPSRFVLPLIITVGAVIMILYGMRLLGVHVNVAKMLHKITKE